jgi:precorrin-2 dehydrogenase/sirohydrochlorin ferrochelatase
VKYYPAFLNLHNKKAVVVGGGRVAERKVRLLISAGASVTLISPDMTSVLKKLAEKKSLKHLKRNYRKGDLKGAFIVIAGTSSPEVNRQIAQEAGQLVNVIDLPSEGNYIVPSVVKSGPLTIAISTEGASPALSKAIRKEIAGHYGREFASYLRFVEVVRKKALKKITNDKKREKFLKSLASEELLNTLRNKGFRNAQKRILASLDNISS